jgi:hypothetical protein
LCAQAASLKTSSTAGAAQKARHQDRAEYGGGRDGVKGGAGEDDRTYDTGDAHREPGFLQRARDLCRLSPPVAPSLPLYHFERRFVVDLQAQIFKSDGQMPTVCPPQFLSLEFTEKAALSVSSVRDPKQSLDLKTIRSIFL